MKHQLDIAEAARLYREGFTTRKLGGRFGVPSRTLARYLSTAGVALRNPGGVHKVILDDGDWLRDRYTGDKLSTTQIAALVGCTARVVNTWLDRHGITRRSRGSEKGHARATEQARQRQSEARRDRYLGAANPNWKGGKPKVDPERNRYRSKAWVLAVKTRDGFRCVECGSQGPLHAHHIKRWKDYPELRFEVSNGLTLCIPCHELAHGRGFKFRFKHAGSSTSAPPPMG